MKFGITVATTFAAVFIWWGLSESAKYDREASYQTSEYAKYTSNKVAETCIQLTQIEKSKCLGEALDAQRKNEREEEDLVAQRQSALWAYIMAAAAVIGMGLSVIGVFLVWTTFAETREANVISKATAEAASNDAKASRDALVLAERAVLRVLRARIELGEGARGWEASLIIENTGRSNAHRLRIDYAISDTPDFPEKFTSFFNYASICQPQTSPTLRPFFVRQQSDFPKFMIGVLSYATVHEAPFKSFFCLWIGGIPSRDNLGGEVFRYFEPWPCKGIPHDT